MCWNIEGISNKLYDTEILDYLSNFDIFALVETWESSENNLLNLFPNHKCLFCPAVRSSQYGRAMSGIAVYIRNSLVQYFKRLTSDCRFGIFLEADKQLFSLEESLLLCFIYLPPDNSPFYRNVDTCGIKCLENHMLKPEIARFGANMLILGDVNARTAERDDYINEIRVVPTLRHYEEDLQDDIFTKRASCDTHTNKFGLELIEFCFRVFFKDVLKPPVAC